MSRQREFVAVPRALVRDQNISAGAKHAYLILSDIAFQAGWREVGEEIELPTRDLLADACGTSVATLGRHLTELAAAGWITTRRASRRAPSRYVIHDDRTGPRPIRNERSNVVSTAHLAPDSDARVASEMSDRTGATPSLTTRDIRESLRDSLFDPLVGCRVDRANLPFDALVEATGATGRLNGGRVAVALRSIREEAWASCVANGFPLERAQSEPEVYERRLASEIALRANRLRSEHPEWTITPETVARYWSRLAADVRPASRAQRIEAAAARALEAVAR